MSIHYVPAKRPPTPDIMGAMLEAKVKPELIDVLRIKTNGGTQMRAGLNAETVGEYMQTLKDSDQAWPFPPVIVFFDGTDYWLADGFHRVAAMRQLERIDEEIPADVRVGDRRAAVLYAAGANAVHGLRRTNADKRRAVEVLLRDEEWAAWSDHEIARRCVVDPKTVGNIRKELAASMEIPQMPTERTVSRGGQTYAQNVSNIGATKPVYLELYEVEFAVKNAFDAFYQVDEQRNAPGDMRAAARTGTGGFWAQVIKQLGDRAYRKNDLAQAIDSLASRVALQVEVASRATSNVEISAGTDLDPWAVAVNMAGSRQSRSEALARAMTPWIREYRDTYGRNWQDLALHGNPSHSNSTFWQDIGKELKLRAVTVDDDTLKLAIKQAFSWLLAEEPAAKTQPAPQQPAAWDGVTAHTWDGYADWNNDDQAEYDALSPLWELPAGTFNSINEARRITRWRVAARLASERRDNLAFSLQESARHLMRAERYAADDAWRADIASRQAAADEAASAPAVAQTGMNQLFVKGSLRRWLGERYAGQDDPAMHMYQMLDNWLAGSWLYDLETFTATLPAGWTQDALDQAIRELHMHFAPDEEEQAAPAEDTAQPVIGLDDLAVVDSVAGPTGWTDPEPESDLDSYDDESATLAARRMNKLHTLKVRFGETIDLLDEFGDLTGRHTASLLAKRELTNLLEILDSEMNALEKGMRGV